MASCKKDSKSKPKSEIKAPTQAEFARQENTLYSVGVGVDAVTEIFVRIVEMAGENRELTCLAYTGQLAMERLNDILNGKVQS